MRVRGATWSGQLGWMVLGAYAICVVAAVGWIAFWIVAGGGDFFVGLFWIAVILLYLLPTMTVVTLVTFSGYRLGGLLARLLNRREGWDLALSAVGAVVFGAALALVISRLTEGALDVYFLWGAVGVAGSVAAVTLARLPLDSPYVRRESTDWDPRSDEL